MRSNTYHNNSKKILILSQKVDYNDDLLGFFHGWVNEFAQNCEKVTVICLQKGEYNLPENVKVLSLGKEGGRSKIKYVWRFFKYIFAERKNYDSVWVHMNKEYVLLGGLLWKILGKKVVLWYAHYLINWSFKLATALSDVIVTSTKFACKIKSPKLQVVGQGVDIDLFKNFNVQKTGNKILFLGRISPVKDLEILLDAFKIAQNTKQDLQLSIVGVAAEGHEEYEEKIKQLAKQIKGVDFVGKVSHHKTAEIYNSHDLFVNLTCTGSFDKTTLEAMASEILVVVSNKSYYEIFPKQLHEKMIFQEKDPQDLARKILVLLGESGETKKQLGLGLRKIILENHSVKSMVQNILKWL